VTGTGRQTDKILSILHPMPHVAYTDYLAARTATAVAMLQRMADAHPHTGTAVAQSIRQLNSIVRASVRRGIAVSADGRSVRAARTAVPALQDHLKTVFYPPHRTGCGEGWLDGAADRTSEFTAYTATVRERGNAAPPISSSGRTVGSLVDAALSWYPTSDVWSRAERDAITTVGKAYFKGRARIRSGRAQRATAHTYAKHLIGLLRDAGLAVVLSQVVVLRGGRPGRQTRIDLVLAYTNPTHPLAGRLRTGELKTGFETTWTIGRRGFRGTALATVSDCPLNRARLQALVQTGMLHALAPVTRSMLPPLVLLTNRIGAWLDPVPDWMMIKLPAVLTQAGLVVTGNTRHRTKHG
jgi:hypothetical protein